MTANDPLYKRLLGDRYERLPAPIQAMHVFEDQRIVEGLCEVQRGRNPFTRLVASFFRFPREGANIPIRVTFDARSGREIWTREFAGQKLRTVQWLSSMGASTLLAERFGPACIFLDVGQDEQGLYFESRRLTLFGVPLPRFLFPRVAARERVEGGRFVFDVQAELPLLGLLIRYRGWLSPAETKPAMNGASAALPAHAAHPIMLFDGVCNLCCAGVRFFMARDREGCIRYCAMQSGTGQDLLRRLDLPLTDFKTFAVLDGKDLYLRSDAVFHLFRLLPMPWRWLEAGRVVPRLIRDWAYDKIATNRYVVTGRRLVCFAPSAEDASRFL